MVEGWMVGVIGNMGGCKIKWFHVVGNRREGWGRGSCWFGGRGVYPNSPMYKTLFSFLHRYNTLLLNHVCVH